MQELQYDIRKTLLEMSGYNRETLEVLLKKIVTEYIEREIMKLPKYREGLDIALQQDYNRV